MWGEAARTFSKQISPNLSRLGLFHILILFTKTFLAQKRREEDYKCNFEVLPDGEKEIEKPIDNTL